MRYGQAQKMEIIKLVENSRLSVKATLKELDMNRSTFYDWYRRYLEHGYDGLASSYKKPRQFWNQIPETERERVVETALEKPELSPRELACHITPPMAGLFHLGIECLSYPESSRPDLQPDLYGYHRGGQVLESDEES